MTEISCLTCKHAGKQVCVMCFSSEYHSPAASPQQGSKRTALTEWQPIETAPKDFVSVFDGWNGDRVVDVSWAHPEYSPKGHYAWCVSEYTNGHGYDNVEVKGLTHWMPIPSGPVIKAAHGITGEAE